jgi:Activator of Hsp90 ATPase homolog 1-like protein
MNSTEIGRARAVADLAEGHVLATVEMAASPERVFRALTSKEIVGWWVRAGVFNTTEWTGDVRAGGRWRASGIGRGKPYVLEGEFLESRSAAKTRAHVAPGRNARRTDDRDVPPRIARRGNTHNAPTLGLHLARVLRKHLHRMGDELRAGCRNSGWGYRQIASRRCLTEHSDRSSVWVRSQ